MKKIVLILFIIAIGFAQPYTSEKLDSNLKEAGENEQVIRDYLKNISDDELLDACSFILAYMPAVDLVSVDMESFADDVNIALYTRHNMPWGEEYSQEIFFNFVLAHRVSQEPLEYWRGYLLSQLSPRIDTLETATEAAIEINRWCAEHVYFKQTQRQDQGVFETLKSGYGRCEEMAIIYICALRACGIPAREAWTPYWTTGDNNHAWVEVWADGDWHFTGGCEPKPTLDNAWFQNSVKTAAVVFNSCYGKPLIDEPIYKEKDNFAIIYSTHNYGVKPGVIEVSVPSESLDVNLSIYNWGAMRTILHQLSDEKGFAEFHVNKGDYYISVGDSLTYADTLVHVEHGKTIRIELASRYNESISNKYKFIFK